MVDRVAHLDSLLLHEPLDSLLDGGELEEQVEVAPLEQLLAGNRCEGRLSHHSSSVSNPDVRHFPRSSSSSSRVLASSTSVDGSLILQKTWYSRVRLLAMDGKATASRTRWATERPSPWRSSSSSLFSRERTPSFEWKLSAWEG